MSAEGRFFITPHAVEQYIRRFCVDGTDYDTALAELIELTSSARFVAYSKRADRAEIWECKRIGKKQREHRVSRMRFVVGRMMPGPLPQVVTVLPRSGCQKTRIVADETQARGTCEVCSAAFSEGRHGPQRTCGRAPCVRELNRRRCAEWYRGHREQHLANVKARACVVAAE